MKTKRIRTVTPEQKARAKARAQTPEAKAQRKVYHERPDVKARAKARIAAKRKTPEARAKKKASERVRMAKPGMQAKRTSYQKEWYNRPGMAARKRGFKLKFLYGMSTADYDKMYQDQEARCAICGIHQSELKKALGVDHNHITDVVRGLLCSNCNTAIGKLNSDTDSTLLRRAADYIDNNN